MPTVSAFSVIAIIAAYNEADIIGQVVGDLISQGVGVYVLDHGSTDGTAAALAPYLGHGLLAIEPFPRDPSDRAAASRFAWADILHRKEELTRELDATWFIHHDADEFRETPWIGVSLADGIRAVDAAGYNAVDFAVLNFWPVHDGFKPGDDVMKAFPYYEDGAPFDRIQIRCWKKSDAPVDLASSGGHEAQFPGRTVFPIRFVLRHYPVRSQAHGRRKVFLERIPRFLTVERDRGWHVQYDAFPEGMTFIRDPTTLSRWDPTAVRLSLMLRHRGVEQLEEDLAGVRRSLAHTEAALAASSRDCDVRRHALEHSQSRLEAQTLELERLRGELEARQSEIAALMEALQTCNGARGSLRTELEAQTAETIALRRQLACQLEQHDTLRHWLEERTAEVTALQRERQEQAAEILRYQDRLDDTARHLEAMRASWSWRCTTPLRTGLRWFRGH